MSKEIILDITTGIVVLGSVFGFSHLRKITIKITQVLEDRKLFGQAQRKPIQSDPGSALRPEDSRSA
jgi:hypothetical protein